VVSSRPGGLKEARSSSQDIKCSGALESPQKNKGQDGKAMASEQQNQQEQQQGNAPRVTREGNKKQMQSSRL
tara:strand:+ start:639 stop:854 length:216 start_codon:yes stop_codon:yes gene_type:complete